MTTEQDDWMEIKLSEERPTGVCERLDHTFYDTCEVNAGDHLTVFDKWERIGNLFLTNLDIPSSFASDCTYTVAGLGLRCIGKERTEEDLLLDHIHACLEIGGRPILQVLGPQASILRHFFTEEEAERARMALDELGDSYLERLWKLGIPRTRCGYQPFLPVVIAVRQVFRVRIQVSPELSERVKLRTYLFGTIARSAFG